MLNKRRLVDHLILALELNYETAISAAKRAHSTATDKANIAENKYDTLALEAAYLAEGHATRASECYADLRTIQNLTVLHCQQDDAITVGACVSLIDEDEKLLILYLAPVSGGLKFIFEGQSILVITKSSPLGARLLGMYLDDDFKFGSGQHAKTYRIIDIA